MAASALIAAFTALNCLGVGRTAKVQNVLTATKLVVIAGFVVIGFAVGTGDWSHFSEHAVRTSTVALPTQFMISLLWVMVGYSGWNAATYIAEEVRRPERTLPAAIAAGSLIVAVLYLGLNMIFIYATPLENLKGVIAVGTLSASNLFGPACGRRVLRADGDLDRVHGERHGHHRPARVLRHGEEQGVLPRRGASGPALAYAGERHPQPGTLRHGDDRDAVSRTGGVHRVQPDAVHRALRGVDFRLSPPAARAGSACARWISPGR